MTLDEAKKELNKYCAPGYWDREHTHHLVGYTLRQVAEAYSVEQANCLIDDFEITALFGIEKVKE